MLQNQVGIAMIVNEQSSNQKLHRRQNKRDHFDYQFNVYNDFRLIVLKLHQTNIKDKWNDKKYISAFSNNFSKAYKVCQDCMYA